MMPFCDWFSNNLSSDELSESLLSFENHEASALDASALDGSALNGSRFDASREEETRHKVMREPIIDVVDVSSSTDATEMAQVSSTHRDEEEATKDDLDDTLGDAEATLDLTSHPLDEEMGEGMIAEEEEAGLRLNDETSGRLIVVSKHGSNVTERYETHSQKGTKSCRIERNLSRTSIPQ